jgi:hypothetical protein
MCIVQGPWHPSVKVPPPPSPSPRPFLCAGGGQGKLRQAAGFQARLIKPITVDGLQTVIEQVMQSSRSGNPPPELCLSRQLQEQVRHG